MKKLIIIIFLICCYAYSSEDMTISFRTHKFDPLLSTPKLRSSLQTTEIEGENYYILQFTGPIYTKWKEQISKAGGVFYSYVPHFAYIVQMNLAERREIEKFPFVRWIGLFHPEYKIHPSVYKKRDSQTENKLPMVLAEFKGNKLEVLREKECSCAKDALWVPNDPLLQLSVRFFSGTSLDQTAHELENWGSDIQQIQENCNRMIVRIPPDSLNALARMQEVQSIVRYSKRTLSSSVWRYSVQVPASSFTIQQDQEAFLEQPMDTVTSGTTLADKGITGEGEIVTIFDSGLDYWSGFFQDPENDPPGPSHIAVEAYTAESGDIREVATSNDPYGCFHGTNIASIVAGNPSIANNHPNGMNLMPIYDWGGQTRGNTVDHFPVRLYIQDFGITAADDSCDLGAFNFTAALNRAYNTYNSKIHQNSWNYPQDFAAGEYVEEAIDVDNMVWNNKDFVVVFSAGNFGPDTTSVRPPSTAKNCISVGSSWVPSFDVSPDSIAVFSGRGWTTDGRIKPDVVAPGGTTATDTLLYRHYVWGAYPNTGWAADSAHSFINGLVGTSQAAPQISAACAMIRQYFKDGFYPSGDTLSKTPFNPSAALVKAVLIASTVDMKNGDPVPSRAEGWGRVVLDNALYFSGESSSLFVSDNTTGVTTGDSVVNMVNIAHATYPIKFVLAWSDTPAANWANPTLVNDLDLIVTAPNSTSYLGNVFSNGFSHTGGTADNKNNVEVVLLPSSAPTGTYRITVRGRSCPDGSIPFAIVALDGNKGSSRIPEEYENSTVSFKYLNVISPFFENTNIQLNIKKTSDVDLSIYDLSGRKTITLINDRLYTGTYSATWGENSTQGVYFAVLKIDGKKVEKRKIVKIAK